MENSVIACRGISKIYKLYDRPFDRVKDALGIGRKKYKEYRALNNIDLDIYRGECVGIIGINGAGKSTLLKIITGVLNSSSGTVEVDGKISALLELGAGFNMEYTGIENVYVNGRMTGFSNKEINDKLQDILDFADIGDYVYQPVKTYSSGMFVRLAFAVAINIEPDILIVDEALAVGDIFFQAKCFNKFEEFKKQGKTILFVSHALGTIQRYCDRAVLLNKGEKVSEGTPKEIIDLYNRMLSEERNERLEEKEKTEKTEMDVPKDDGRLWKSQLLTNPNILQYGNKGAEIVDFCVIDASGAITNNVIKDTVCTIRMKVFFHQDIKDPIFAFTIKDIKGVELTGSNTMIEGVETGTVRAGEYRTITFSQKMILQGAEYLICLGCTGFVGGELTVYDRLYDVCTINVLSSRNTVGIFDINSKVKIEENG